MTMWSNPTGRLTLAGLAGLLFLAASTLHAEAATESRVKSAFLYNFTKFVAWPVASFSNLHEPFTICTLGADDIESTLEDTVNGKTIDARQLRARKLHNEHEIQGCQVLFIPGALASKRSSVLDQLHVPGLLTVTESAATEVPRGAVISFVLDANRVRFVIDNKAADKAGLSISSKLLSLALEVKR